MGAEVGESALRGLVRLSRQAETAMAEFGLTLSQYRVLDRLSGGRAAGKSLAEWLSVRPPTVTSLVDVLVARGLVDRHPDPQDRRRVAHELTERGRSVYSAVNEALAAKLSRVAACAPDEATAALLVEALAGWNDALARSGSRRLTPIGE